ncbi:MAG: HEAT repeat domain-containing protein [Defluviicoccus sp.]|nr:HEAT repeat domain-containing protein [Defluviicoccus sp.]
MSGQQLDLFSVHGISPDREPQPTASAPRPVAAELDDDALLAAIPDAGLADGPALAYEAGRRRLAAAVPVLERLCRRFTGFGGDRAVPEQVAALDALAAIGGREASDAVARIITKGAVQGPTLAIAVATAARLQSRLPADVGAVLLRHADARLRADACRLAPASPPIIAILLDLLADVDAGVRASAACALGRLGRPEARVPLARLLRVAPTLDVIDAVTLVADEECMILMARIVRTVPQLAEAARAALDAVDHPRARQLISSGPSFPKLLTSPKQYGFLTR